jgi:hypothetical protein
VIHLFWSGRGFLVPVVTFCSCFAMEPFTRAAFHDDRYHQTHGWPILSAFLISASKIRAARNRTRGGSIDQIKSYGKSGITKPAIALAGLT